MAKSYSMVRELKMEWEPSLQEKEKQRVVEQAFGYAKEAYYMAAVMAASGHEDLRKLSSMYQEIGRVWESQAVRLQKAEVPDLDAKKEAANGD